MVYFPKPPRKSDKQINFDTYNQMYEQSKKFQNLQFDPSVFYTQQDPTGYYVTLNQEATSSNGSSEQFHFQLATNSASNVGSALIDVHCGEWQRGWDGLNDSSGHIWTLGMKDNSGTPRTTYEFVKTLTLADGLNYVYLEIDEPIQPTQLSVLSDVTSPDIYPRTRKLLGTAQANVNSGSVTFEQYWSGGNIDDTLMYQCDDYSTQIYYPLLTTSQQHNLEIYNYHDRRGAALDDIADTDLLVKCNASDSDKISYTLWSNAKSDVRAGIYDDPSFCNHVEACVQTWGNFCNRVIECDFVGAHPHSEHSSFLTDDHNDSYSNFPYVSPHDNTASPRVGNFFQTTAAIYDSGGQVSIMPDPRALFANAVISVDWVNRILKTSASQTSLNWQNDILYTTSGAISENWTNRTLHNNSAAVTLSWDTSILNNNWSVEKTLSVDKLEISDNPTSNYWDHINLIANVISSITEYAPSIVIRDEAGTRGLQVDGTSTILKHSSDIDIDSSST